MKKPCSKCENYFNPSTKHSRICIKCLEIIKKEMLERNRIKREAKKKNI